MLSDSQPFPQRTFMFFVLDQAYVRIRLNRRRVGCFQPFHFCGLRLPAVEGTTKIVPQPFVQTRRTPTELCQ